MKIFICDKCGKQIDPVKGRYELRTAAQLFQDEEPVECSSKNLDICYSCYQKLCESMAAVDQEKIVSEKTKKSKKKESSIDYGKIIALREAGWTNQKIGEEMDMTPGAVSKAICRERKRREAAEGTEVTEC